MIDAIGRQVRSVRDGMTPGQRWTAALALAFAILVISFGLPEKRVFRAAGAPASAPGAPSGAAGTEAAAPVAAGTAAGAGTSGATFEVPAVGAAPTFVAPSGVGSSPAGDTSPGSTGSTGSTDTVTDEVPAAALTGVVALVQPAEAPAPPGRSDADIAGLFLPDARVVPLDAAATCESLVGSAAVFVAARDVPRPLRSCLTESGAVVVAHDSAGTEGRALSTRRSLAASLAGLGRPEGTVGVVASASVREQVEPLLPALGAVAVRWVPDGPAARSEMGAGALEFASEGVTTVVLVLPAEQQAQWVAQQSVLSPGVRWLVADAFDAGHAESFPPTFDGARLVTVARGPWWTRLHGESEEQARCRAAWEASSGRMLASETVPVYAWCQAGALLSAGGGVDLEVSLRATRYDSPLTAPLGPVGDSWGPTTDADLVWRGSCGCWEAERDFSG